MDAVMLLATVIDALLVTTRVWSCLQPINMAAGSMMQCSSLFQHWTKQHTQPLVH